MRFTFSCYWLRVLQIAVFRDRDMTQRLGANSSQMFRRVTHRVRVAVGKDVRVNVVFPGCVARPARVVWIAQAAHIVLQQ